MLRGLWPLTLRGTGALALAFVSFVVAHEAGLVELIYFAMLLVVVLAASLASLWLTRRIDTVSRSLSSDATPVGRESVVTVRVGTRTALPASPGTWEDFVPPGLDATARGVFPAVGSSMRGGERSVDLRYAVVGGIRGVHTLGPFTLIATDPFGLARRRVRAGGTTRVTVAPRLVELAALTTVGGETGGMLQDATAQLGQGADNLVARPWAPGDSMRRIHWRASAHRDTLMVRQEEQEASPQATVVLDLGASRWSAEAARIPGADPGFETAVSAALSAVSRLVRDGFSVEVIDADGTVVSDPILGGETSEIDALATQFATLTARRGEGLATLAAHFTGGRTGPVVVVTGRLRIDDAEALAPLAQHSALAVMIATAPSADAIARLRAHGWHAAAAPAEDDLADAWDRALERNAERVGG